jgi:Spy/CpxP family protein refolding chaperone
MKHIRISLIVALIIGAVAAVSSVRAADATDSKAPTAAPAGKQRMTAEQRLDQMAERLGLNAEQKGKLKTAMETQAKANRELRSDSSFAALSQPEKQAKTKVITDEFNKQVKAFLTDEQKTKFDTLTQQQGKKGRKKAQ